MNFAQSSSLCGSELRNPPSLATEYRFFLFFWFHFGFFYPPELHFPDFVIYYVIVAG